MTDSINIPANTLNPWFNTGEKKALGAALSYLNDTYIAPLDNSLDSLDTRVDILETEVINVKSVGAVGNGVVNDTAAFVTALAGGGRVYVPAGTYLINGITVGNNTKLFGAGAASILKPYTVGTSPLILVGTVNGEVCDLKIDASGAGNVEVQVVKAMGQYMNVHDLTILGGGTSFSGYACTDSVARQLTISGYKYHGATFDGAGTARCAILDCNIDGTGSTVGNCTQIMNAKDCKIGGNIVRNAYIFGCFLADAVDSVISGNIAKNTRLEAFQMATTNRCEIIDNSASWDAGIGQDFGISLWAPDALPCNYNVISGNRLYNSCKAGISLEGSAGGLNAYTKITGNYIYNACQNGDTNYGAINLYGAGVQRTQITDNYIYSNDSKVYYGIRETLSSYSAIRDNTILGTVGATIFKVASSTTALSGEILGSTGTGAWAPVVTAEAGTITTLGQVAGRCYELEKMVFISGSVAITTIGTATGGIKVTFPYTPSATQIILNGWEVSTGTSLRILSDGAGTFIMRKYDGTPININNSVFQFSGWYERL